MESSLIAVSGNIGSGKSTLTAKLARAFDGNALYETVKENPYIGDYYAEMARWGFHSQIFFLTSRLSQYQNLDHHDGVLVQDRFIEEDAEVFARNLHNKGLIDARDWAVYYHLYQNIHNLLPGPDLIVYLEAEVDTLLARIQSRGRDYEKLITADYLRELSSLYENWISTFPAGKVIHLKVEQTDYLSGQASIEPLVQAIKARLSLS